MIVSIIAAVSENGVIGDCGRMPWHYPEDLKRFKKITMGHALIMGRKTFDSIGKALPGRRNIVLTRNPALRFPKDVLHSTSLESALQLCEDSGEKETFIIGGADLYAQAMPLAQRFYRTSVNRSVEGDTSFPPWAQQDWKRVSLELRGELTFERFERR